MTSYRRLKSALLKRGSTLTSRRRSRLSRSRLARLAFTCVVAAPLLSANSQLRAGTPRETLQPLFSGHQLVVLLDTNPHQKEVLRMELALAEGVIERLGQPGNVFSIITFGSQPPALLKSRVQADEAIAAIRNVTLEQTKEKYFSVHLYDALNLAFSQFTNDPRPKSILVISEGNDYFPGKTFKQTVFQARQLQVTFDIALVADHAFYGTKGIQRYGFDLRRLVGKTHGRYVEVGGGQKKVPHSVDRLSESILGQDRGR